MDEAYEPLVTNVLRILEKNGYPAKRVALPLERMYEVAYEKKLNFNKALDILQSRGVAHEKTTEKIIFFPHVEPKPEAFAMPEGFQMPEGMDMAAMMAQAQEMLKNMTDEERAQLMAKAKDMGLL